jgi:hypothetical protein
MRRISGWLAFAVLFCTISAIRADVSAQTIFSEDFEGGVLPSGWTVFDGDGQTPSNSVNYFTSAWIVRADFDIVGDTAAMSTSWYFPLTGPSDDWLITPQISVPGNVELRWEGESQDPVFPESYEVRVSAAANPLPVSSFSTILTTVSPEAGGVRTQRSVPLTTLTGNLYFAWRNISFDQYILVIDNVELRNLLPKDVSVTDGYRPEFTMIPEFHASSIPVKGEVSNVGSDTATNVSLTVNVYNGAFTQVYSNTSTAANLPPGVGLDFNLPSFMPAGVDFYTFEYIANLSNDMDRSNDTLYWSVMVTDSTMARDDGQRANTLGIGGGNGGVLGQTFILDAPDFIASVSCNMDVTAGQPYFAEIYNFNGLPTSVIARTDTFVSQVDTTMDVLLPIFGGAVYLPLDTFYIGIPEPDTALNVGVSNNVFTLGATFLDWPTNPFNGWSNNEDFSFNVIYMLRANLEKPCPAYGLSSSVQNAACNASDGFAQIFVSGGGGPFTYQWSANANNQTTALATNLAAGLYNVTVTDTIGCTATTQVIVNNLGSPTISNVITNNVLCHGDSTGSASVTVTAGNPPYSFNWSSGSTGAVAIGLSAGTYSLTVTDQNLCQVIQSVTITETATVLPTVSVSPANCSNCPNGSAGANPSGGTPPYSYSWSSGSTNQAVTGLVPGNYSVTVTDDNGCTGMALFTVGFVVGMQDELAMQVEIFPNPSDGNFRIRVQTAVAEDLTIEIYNELGQIAWRHTEPFTQKFDRQFVASQLASGSYLVRVKSGEKLTVKRLRIL